MGKNRAAVPHPTVLRTASHRKELPWLKTSVAPRLRNPDVDSPPLTSSSCLSKQYSFRKVQIKYCPFSECLFLSLRFSLS